MAVETIVFDDGTTETKTIYGFPGSTADAGGVYGGSDGFFVYSYNNLPLVIGDGTEKLFADLPPSPPVGSVANISDSDTEAWGDTINGGGNKHVQGRWNGSAWTIVAK